jgi:hypothetical protein
MGVPLESNAKYALVTVAEHHDSQSRGLEVLQKMNLEMNVPRWGAK